MRAEELALEKEVKRYIDAEKTGQLKPDTPGFGPSVPARR